MLNFFIWRMWDMGRQGFTQLFCILRFLGKLEQSAGEGGSRGVTRTGSMETHTSSVLIAFSLTFRH